MTQLEAAFAGTITPEASAAARAENVPASFVRQEVAAGRAVIASSKAGHDAAPIVIGSRFRVKINANIGASAGHAVFEDELQKMKAACEFGADTVMDLSSGGDIDSIRTGLLAQARIPVGTVPVYQVAKEHGVCSFSPEDFFRVVERQAEQGVDYMTVHCGVKRSDLSLIEGRLTSVVSRGGALMIGWMVKNGAENPLLEKFDRLLEIARKWDVTLSLGDALRPGSIHDSTDEAQLSELRTLGSLSRRARRAGVQVMIEGPGHVPLHEIRRNMELEQIYCDGAPFYVLGPIVTDVAPGYDHITGAVGAAWAAFFGASMLCYVTPKEHLGLPDVEDVKRGVVAFKLAAHAADVARGIRGARDWDDSMSRARKALDWGKQYSFALDPDTARSYHCRSTPEGESACSMCADLCAMKMMSALKEDVPK